MPLWAEEDWVRCFTNLITDEVKLAGIKIDNNSRFVQSMFLVTDGIGVRRAIMSGIFSTDPIPLSKRELIHHKEQGISFTIMNNGYCLDCICGSDKGCCDPDPLVTIFAKMGPTCIESVAKTISYTRLMNMSYPGDRDIMASLTSSEPFDWILYLRLHPDVAEEEYSESFARFHYENYGKRGGRARRWPVR